MLRYRIKLESDDNDTLLATCPELPGMVTFGEDPSDAIRHASDAIEERIASLIADGEDVPRPRIPARLAKDEAVVTLPAMTALKVELYRALRAAGVTRAELARRLEWNRESVDRLFRLDHASRLSQLEAAFHALHKTLDVRVRENA